MQQSTIISLNARRYFAAGMFWHAESSEPKKMAACIKRMRAETLKTSDQVKPTHYIANVTTDHAQVGFANVPDSKVNAASLALLVRYLAMEAGKPTWAALFQLDEQTFWFGAAIDGVVSADADIVGSKELVMEAYGASVVIIDERCHFFIGDGISDEQSDTPPVFLIEWLEEIPQKQWDRLRLKPASRSLPLKHVALAAILATAALGGAWWWQKMQAESKAMAIRAVQARLAAAQAKQAQAVVPVAAPVISPWATQLRPSQFIAQCHRYLSDGLFQPVGWATKELNCLPAELKAAFVRESVSAATAAELKHWLPQVTLMPGGGRATWSFAFPVSSVLLTNDELLDEQALIALVQGQFQALGLKADLQAVVAAPAVVTSGPVGSPAVPAFKKYKLLLSGSGMPLIDLSASMDAVPTLRLVRASLLDPNVLDVEGEVYAK